MKALVLAILSVLALTACTAPTRTVVTPTRVTWTWERPCGGAR